MKIIFWGSDDFAATHLESLIQSRHQVLACVTQPDKPKGRFLHVEISLIKQIALRHGITILQPQKLENQDFLEKLKLYAADLFVVIAYGRILTEEILSFPKRFCINVHASLLPKYRGASPINWAIMSGETQTGISIIKMIPKLDAGDILIQETIPIADQDTASCLKKKMLRQSPALLLRSIQEIESESYQLTAQDSSRASYSPKLTKEMGCIDWQQEARGIHNLIRGLQPWPGAYTYYGKKILKILGSKVVDVIPKSFRPGQMMEKTSKGFIVATACQGLLVSKVHLESSRAMAAVDFMSGHPLEKGFSFDRIGQ